MRIVHVVCTANFAGVESHVASLAHQQISEGDRVTVIGGDPRKMPTAGDFDWRLGTRTQDASRALRQIPADVIHVHMTRAEVAATLLTRLRPIVATRHFARRRAMSTRGLIAPLIASRIAAQIAVSKYVAEVIETPAVVIPAGVPNHGSVRPSKERDKVVLVLQRLEEEKRPEDALVAFQASRLWEASWRLQFVGGGSLSDEVRRRAASMGLSDHVDLLGYQDDPTPHLERAGMLMAPCHIEAQGLAVLEAMSRALPVVAAAAGGHLESLGPVRGAAVYDPTQLDDAALWLQRLAHDPTLSDQYGRELQSVQRERFTLSAQSRAVRRVYEGVLGWT